MRLKGDRVILGPSQAWPETGGDSAHSYFYLEVELSGGLLELSAVGGQLGQLNVDGGADGGAQVGRAEGQEAEAVVVREGNPLLDLVDGVDKAGIDGLQVTTLLHRDDAQVIFLIAPDQESLVVVVVDTTASGPVSASVGSLQSNRDLFKKLLFIHFVNLNSHKHLEEAITLLEEEVVVDELLLDILGHASQWVVGALEFAFQSGKSGRHFVFHLLVLGLSQAGVEGVALHGAAATDAGGDDELALNMT